jgi:hypothetical protein
MANAPLIGYYKGEPTDYLLVYSGERLTRSGAGLAFYYWRPSTSIVSVPTSTLDTQFIFNETTGNFQAVTVQGQLTYRIADPRRMAAILNFTVDPATGAWTSNDPEKLAQRIVNVAQVFTKDELLQLPLEDALRQAAPLAAKVLARMQAEPALAEMGVECVGLYFTAIKPTPEMAKALEADYREALQVKADQAIYNRRALAVEQERRIKENELNTQVTLEQKRQELVDLQGQNNLKQADYDARANEVRLAPFLAAEPRRLVALGLRELGLNAEKIGNLMITPEILAGLLNSHA